MDIFDYICQTTDKSKLTTWLERARKAHDQEVAKAVERRLIELEKQFERRVALGSVNAAERSQARSRIHRSKQMSCVSIVPSEEPRGR